MSYTRINPTAESQNALVYKGYVPSTTTDFNSVTTMGIYMLGSTTMTNAPAQYQWRFLVVLGSGAVRHQFVFGNMNDIYFRGFTGNPGTWGAWRKITSST